MDNEFNYNISESEPAAPQPEEVPAYAQPQYSYRYTPVKQTAFQSTATAAPAKKKNRWTTGKVIALVLVCCILGGCFDAGGVYLLTRGDKAAPAESAPEEIAPKDAAPTKAAPNDVVPEANTPEASVPEDDSSSILVSDRTGNAVEIKKVTGTTLMTAAEVYAANVNSTVGITTSITVNYWGYKTTTPASGSGFILTEDGYIITNFHVVEDSDSIKVATYDGTSYDAELVGYIENNDIAVLKIDAKGLTPVVLGNSDLLNVGDSVIAIGNPLGELTFSLTSGCVSALNRSVTMSSGVTMELIQTDAAINAGNSGGPLFNMYGEVIGITNAKYSSSGSSSEASIDNIGFAIPINQVFDIIQDIIDKGYISKPYIGISVSDVSSDMQAYGVPTGAAVISVTEGAPAEAAGLKANDIITEADGNPIKSSSDLISYIGSLNAGDTLVLTVYRQGQTISITVTVSETIQKTLPETSNQEQNPYSNMPYGNGESPYGGNGESPYGGYSFEDLLPYIFGNR